MKTQKQRRRITPFTLIEVVVVIVILVTLASVATPMYMKYIQKAKISVAEWGTEAAAVTVVEMQKESAIGPGEEKVVYFYADHPFVFAIGESTSGTILFEGTFTGI